MFAAIFLHFEFCPDECNVLCTCSWAIQRRMAHLVYISGLLLNGAPIDFGTHRDLYSSLYAHVARDMAPKMPPNRYC